MFLAIQYIFFSLLLIAALQVATCLAVKHGRAIRVFEAASGSSVAAACLATLVLRGSYFPRQVISTALIVAWGLRLSHYLYTRALCKDKVNVFMRIAWSLLCALPVIICNTQQKERYRQTAVEMLAVLAAAVSLYLEHLADQQKARWHAAHPQRPERGDMEPPVCATGLWAFSRHPNLFFELTFHWSIFAIVHPVEAPVTLLSPVVLTALIVFFPGGIITQESQRNAAYGLHPAYVLYRRVTPVLFPFPGVKNVLAPELANILCLELPLYTL